MLKLILIIALSILILEYAGESNHFDWIKLSFLARKFATWLEGILRVFGYGIGWAVGLLNFWKHIEGLVSSAWRISYSLMTLVSTFMYGPVLGILDYSRESTMAWYILVIGAVLLISAVLYFLYKQLQRASDFYIQILLAIIQTMIYGVIWRLSVFVIDCDGYVITTKGMAHVITAKDITAILACVFAILSTPIPVYWLLKRDKQPWILDVFPSFFSILVRGYMLATSTNSPSLGSDFFFVVCMAPKIGMLCNRLPEQTPVKESVKEKGA